MMNDKNLDSQENKLKKIKRAPELRFKGFSDDWEQRKLGELSNNTFGGGTPKTSIPEYWEGTIPWIQSSDLNTDELFNIAPNKYITDIAVKDSATKLVPANSIAIVTRVGVGKLAFMPFQYATSQDFLSLSNLNIDNIFSIFSIYRILQKELKNIQGTSIKGITKPDLLAKTISVPIKMEEQKKIGTFFKQLDNTITLHQRKLDKLKQLKQGYLQQLFPQNGENTPRISFANFVADWEERKLGEVADIIGGGTPSTSIAEYWEGNIDWYSPVEIGDKIYITESRKKISELGLQKSSAKILPVGTVLFTSRAGIGNTAILTKEGATNQGFQSIVPRRNELDSYFVYSRTDELKRYGELTGAGSTFVEVSGKQMEKMPILIPDFEEQQKIGIFFKQLDNIITLHQEKLKQFQVCKKTLLQKMFI